MEETKVGFETAKLAKEKGFNLNPIQIGFNYYKPDGERLKSGEYNKEFVKYCIPYCTQSLLQKWLREVHNIIVEVVAYYDEEQLPLSKPVKPKGYFAWDYYDDTFTEDKAIKTETYEEALEIGLQEGLKQIKNGSTN
jgi:hypothetical protein